QELSDRFCGIVVRGLLLLEAPVSLDRGPAGIEGEVVSRRQPPQACKESLLSLLEPALLEVLADDGTVRLELPSERAKSLRFAREGELPVIQPIVERLDPEAIPRTEQAPLHVVPDREGPHPVEALDAVVTPFRVGSKHHLGVGGAA